MHYQFPTITHIDQVLAAIEGEPSFKVKETEIDGHTFTVIDYLLSTPEVFPEVTDVNSALRRECRGIMFRSDGTVASRPYHKFFNLGERDDTSRDVVDLSKKHVILDKLDGSMIRPVMVGSDFRLCTKAGVTDVSQQAEQWLRNLVWPESVAYMDFIYNCLHNNATPIS